jgi:predicted nucleotidyltransferase
VDTGFDRLLSHLVGRDVDFILIGGLAAIAHGAARATYDADIVYARAPANLSRLVEALSTLSPYPRGAPPGLPFRWDDRTVRNGLNFTLATSLGPLDLLGEVAGGGTYEQLLPYTIEAEAFGVRLRIVTLERLIQLKRAAGRPKDLEAIAELVALLEERRRSAPGAG